MLEDSKKEYENKLESFTADYENRLTTFNDKLGDGLFDGYVKTVDKTIDFVAAILDKVTEPDPLLRGTKGIEIFIEGFIKLLRKPYIYGPIRFLTAPFSKLWIWGYKRMVKARYKNPLYKLGIHFITAKQGGGKSSIAYYLAEQNYIENGKGAYMNVNMEKARYDTESGHWIKHHKRFDLSEYWNAVEDPVSKAVTFEQKKAFDTTHFDMIILDEWFNQMNHRLNNKRSYNEIFVAMVNALAQCRHQGGEGIKRTYVLSQINKTDTQLEELFVDTHRVQVKLDIPYRQWLKDGMFAFHIMGWNINSMGEVDTGSNRKKRVKHRSKIRINEVERCLKPLKHVRLKIRDLIDDLKSMKYFDTLNQREFYENLPKDKTLTTKGWV